MGEILLVIVITSALAGFLDDVVFKSAWYRGVEKRRRDKAWAEWEANQY